MAKKRNTKVSTPAKQEAQVVISSPGPSRKVVLLPPSPQDLPTIYANNANVEASNWDVKIRLGLIQSVAPDEIQVKDIVALYMSHEHAKAFSDALAGVLARLQELKQRIAKKAESDTTH